MATQEVDLGVCRPGRIGEEAIDNILGGIEDPTNVTAMTPADLSYYHKNVKPSTDIIPTTQGGTGQAFTDFASLSDAIGSGGNWVDVSEKLKNDMVWTSWFTPLSVDAKIYEKRFFVLSFSFTTPNALVADTYYGIFNLPEWACPYTHQSGAHFFAIAELTTEGRCHYSPKLTIPASSPNTQVICFYILKTPYSG